MRDKLLAQNKWLEHQSRYQPFESEFSPCRRRQLSSNLPSANSLCAQKTMQKYDLALHKSNVLIAFSCYGTAEYLSNTT